MFESDTIIITEEEAGERLDKILAKRFEDKQSRTYFQYLIEEHLVLLNGQPVKKRIKPEVGDEIEIQFVLTPEINVEPENIPLDILFEDEHLLAINKPSGMVVHPAVGHWTGTFVNALLYHCKNLGKNLGETTDTLRPGIVHRLDKETSGILIAAKTSQAHQKLIELFASRQMRKEYLAICLGNPGNANIDAPIGRHPVHRKKMAIVETGKSALSRCRTIAHNDKLSLVRIELITGRTHQIRVHMQHHRTPILGDDTYGTPSSNRKYGANRQMLHAEKLAFVHPITGEKIELTAPLPADMSEFVKSIESSKR